MLVPFELHITVEGVTSDRIPAFADLCGQIGGKPLLIELARGNYRQQPMFNKVYYGTDLKHAVELAEDYSEVLARQSFRINRHKIEVPAYCYNEVRDDDGIQNTRYFEWHGKVDFERETLLLAICKNNGAHLSKNALKDNAGQRYVTLREFGDKTVFDGRILTLIKDLEQNNYKIYKQQAEYCVYDTNVLLDKNWLF